MTISNLVIVGNGIDLHHGLKTGYCDFWNEGMSTELKEEYKKLVRVPEAECGGDWFAFEFQF
nr:hypothetical protein [Lacticaseibacillus mingshuiensis]